MITGKCYRVYSNKDFDRMQQSSVAEILRSNLSAVSILKSFLMVKLPNKDDFDPHFLFARWIENGRNSIDRALKKLENR